MSGATIVLLREDLTRIHMGLERLLSDTCARSVFLVNQDGESIGAAGDLTGVDAVSLAALAAGSVAATRGLARLLGEQEFSILFHEGTREHLHISAIPGGGILVVLFDERSSLGLVRLRTKRATSELGAIVSNLSARASNLGVAGVAARDVLADLSDADVDALFR